MIRCLPISGALGTFVLATTLSAQTPRAAALDALLERLVGQWRMTGSVRGPPATYTLDAAHWLDKFGAAFSIPPATGEARGDTIRLAFPYPDGAFRDTFVYERPTDTWYFRLEAADSAGGWQLFAEYHGSPPVEFGNPGLIARN